MSVSFSHIPLSSGAVMPIIGLGTSDPLHDIEMPNWVSSKFGFVGRAFYRGFVRRLLRIYMGYKLSFVVKAALQNGYRMIDTSAYYNNEHLIRRGIRWSKVPREELFIITRASNQQQWSGDIRGALLGSLRALGTDYVDLYMFHWPVPDVFENTWKQMEELYKEGLVKAIGVANCHKHHLEKIEKISTITPMVNEFEIHPLFSQNDLVDYCQQRGIVPIAYTPIGRYHHKLIENETLKSLASKYGKTIPQIILRWHTQRGTPAIPRSMRVKNVIDNISIFDFTLTGEEMRRIGAINENLRLRFDPDDCRFTKPREYIVAQPQNAKI